MIVIRETEGSVGQEQAGPGRNDVADALYRMVGAWAVRRGGEELEAFLGREVGSETAGELLSGFRAVREEEVRWREAREEGATPAGWLGQRLVELEPEIGERGLEVAGTVIGGAGTGFSRAKIAGAVLGGVAAAMEPGLLGALPEAGAGRQDVGEAGRAFLKEVFTSAAGHAVEREAAAVAGAAIVQQAAKIGLKPSPAAVSAAADLGIGTVKALYKVATGEMTVGQATNVVVDRGVAAVAAVARRAVEQAAPGVGAAIGAAIGSLIWMGPVGAQAGRVLGEMAGPVIGTLVEQGVKKVGWVVVEGVKAAAGWVASGVKAAGTAVVSGVKSAWKWLWG